jgi:hypothetical protein
VSASPRKAARSAQPGGALELPPPSALLLLALAATPRRPLPPRPLPELLLPPLPALLPPLLLAPCCRRACASVRAQCCRPSSQPLPWCASSRLSASSHKVMELCSTTNDRSTLRVTPAVFRPPKPSMGSGRLALLSDRTGVTGAALRGPPLRLPLLAKRQLQAAGTLRRSPLMRRLPSRRAAGHASCSTDDSTPTPRIILSMPAR